MESKKSLHKYQYWIFVLLLLAYLVSFYSLYTYKYHSKVGAMVGWGSVNGKSIIVTLTLTLLCTGSMLSVVYAYTLDKGFVAFAGSLFMVLYFWGGFLFLTEKFVSKTLLPDRFNSQVETLLTYPILLILLLVCYKLYKM